MSIKRSYISSPALTFAILCIGLGCIVTATLKQNLAIAGLVAALPALLCILILHLRKPERFLFLLFIFNYFFTPLARYSRQDGLSILSDIIWWSVLLIVIVQTALHYRFPWKQAVNILTIGGAVLAVYCLMEVVNPKRSHLFLPLPARHLPSTVLPQIRQKSCRKNLPWQKLPSLPVFS